MAGRRWTAAEIALLEGRFGVDATSVLARQLSRTSSAVHQRALKLGLVQEDDLSLTEVREILGLGRDFRLIYSWLADGRLVCRRKYGGRRSFIREADLSQLMTGLCRCGYPRDDDHHENILNGRDQTRCRSCDPHSGNRMPGPHEMESGTYEEAMFRAADHDFEPAVDQA
jgi:hypothetical protein